LIKATHAKPILSLGGILAIIYCFFVLDIFYIFCSSRYKLKELIYDFAFVFQISTFTTDGTLEIKEIKVEIKICKTSKTNKRELADLNVGISEHFWFLSCTVCTEWH
jgi:hypothetical protein